MVFSSGEDSGRGSGKSPVEGMMIDIEDEGNAEYGMIF